MVDFTKALNVKVESIERPPLPPLGHYIFKVDKQPAYDVIGDGKWDVVDFFLVATQPTEDVDPDDLKTFGGAKNVRQRIRFMFSKAGDDEAKVNNDRTLFRLKTFLTEHLQLEPGDKTLSQILSESVGAMCLADVKYRQDKTDPSIMYAEIGKTAAVE